MDMGCVAPRYENIEQVLRIAVEVGGCLISAESRFDHYGMGVYSSKTPVLEISDLLWGRWFLWVNYASGWIGTISGGAIGCNQKLDVICEYILRTVGAFNSSSLITLTLNCHYRQL